MNVEIIVASFLNDASITALVGTRKAAVQLPQGTAMPAIIYNIIDNRPQPNLAANLDNQIARARVQINVLANDIAKLKQIHSAIRNVMDYVHKTTVAGKLVVSSRVDIMSQMDKDSETGVWNQSIDYIIQYYE